MVFKKFRVQLILRVVILTLAIVLLAWCFVHGFYLRSVYLTVGILILLIELIVYVDRFNRDVQTFMTSLIQRDFTTHFNSAGKGKSFDALYEILNQISAAFKKLSSEKEIQHRYLEMLVEHVRVSILSIDADERIHLSNQALKDLLQKNVLTSLKSLESFDEILVKTIREIHTGETRLITITVENELLQLSIHASEFKLENRYYKLISMQNIKSELDIREMEAWQKLIRVMSHEIMNSISPITSLSETLHGMVNQHNNLLTSENTNLYRTLDKGLEAIKIRSEGLFKFTQTYRKLTGVPNLTIQKTNLKDILRRVETLMLPKITEYNIQLRISDVDVNVEVDPELMEHVFINLIINAIDALKGQNDPIIDVKISRQQKGKICIHVGDNGEGIPEPVREKIFIPFFTTRKNGSGIGLAITKQILQLHHADIQVKSIPGEGSEFIIIL